MNKLIVAFDIPTRTISDRRRYRAVVSFLLDHGVRVQESIFEIKMRPNATKKFLIKLRNHMNDSVDSFFVLRGRYLLYREQDVDSNRIGFDRAWIV